MKNGNYTVSIEVANTLEDVFGHITDVSKWWGGKDFKGNSTNLADEFIIQHADRHYSNQKLVEVIPGKKMVWLVTDSKLNWLEKDMYEWTGTKMVFELVGHDGKTVLHFTHQGLVPGKECYERCAKGWNMVITGWLFNFITKGETIL